MESIPQVILYSTMRAELLEMYRVDQEACLAPDMEVWRELNERHTTRMKQIIDEHGWPGISLVSQEGAQASWLLVQHADHDAEFQRRALVLLEEALSRGEALAVHVAYLQDRVAVNEGRPQRYGTQGRCIGSGKWEPHPLTEPERVDELRATVGLEPLAEYRALMHGYCP